MKSKNRIHYSKQIFLSVKSVASLFYAASQRRCAKNALKALHIEIVQVVKVVTR
jgi:hypothetical protein